MELADLPLECQQLILEKITHKPTLLNVHRVSKQWKKLAASSRVICSGVNFPAFYDTGTWWNHIVRWARERAGLFDVLRLSAYPSKRARVLSGRDGMRLAEARVSRVLEYAAPSVQTLVFFDNAHLYGLTSGAAFLLGPALPLFSSLRNLEVSWSGNGLERTHLNCLQNSPLLERISVKYFGHVDLGPHFPEGLSQLSHLRHLNLAVASQLDNKLTSFCSLPEGLSQLSALTSLSLVRYVDCVDPEALRHLASLEHLYLAENPIKDSADEGWVYSLPTSLKSLVVSGDSFMVGGRSRAALKGARLERSVPCITGLSQLSSLSFQHLQGFRFSEWNERSCLAGLSKLRGLELSACALVEVPDAILGLSSLRWLCLGSNELKMLPAGQYLEHLESLILVDNKFSSVPVEAVAVATALTHLAMTGNPLLWDPAQEAAVKHIKNFTCSMLLYCGSRPVAFPRAPTSSRQVARKF